MRGEKTRAETNTRVLMLLENASYAHDGRVKREANTLTAAGYRVCVICPRPAGGRFREVIDSVLVYQYPEIPDLPGAIGYIIEWAYGLMGLGLLSLWVWARHGVDVVHAHNPPDLLFLIGAGYKLLGKRFVFDHHDLVPELYAARSGPNRSALLDGLLRVFEVLSCRTADHVIATNQSYARMEHERGGAARERITVVRNGPDPVRFRPSRPERRIPVDGRTHNIVYVGVVNVQDGVEHLMAALVHLAAMDAPPWRCIIVGEGDALARIRAQAEAHGLADRLVFTGWVKQPEVIQYLDEADVCVAPEPSNPLNDHSTIIKVLEYMAMAKPCVAFDLPEHRFSAGDSALYARANDDEDFARQLLALLTDPEMRVRLGAIGRERVESALSWEHQAPRLLQAYDSLERSHRQARAI